jgi:hypothetical protein
MNTARILKIVALLPIGFMSLVFLFFGIGESSGGDLGGLMHIVQFVIAALAMWMCWKCPLWGGILLLAFTLFRTLLLIPEFFLRPPGSIWSPSLFVVTFLPALPGALFLYAGLLERKAASTKLS